MRENGFYWVWTTKMGQPRHRNVWVAAEWNGQNWLLPGDSNLYTDDDFERITAPLPQPWTGYEPAAV